MSGFEILQKTTSCQAFKFCFVFVYQKSDLCRNKEDYETKISLLSIYLRNRIDEHTKQTRYRDRKVNVEK